MENENFNIFPVNIHAKHTDWKDCNHFGPFHSPPRDLSQKGETL